MSEVMQPNTVKIEIDGKSYDVPKGASLIEVADQLGIHIPRFCYHKKLSVAANCRMCMVEVEGARRPCAACATPVMDGMKVQTRSKTTRDYQRSVMEFLLINHPLDCPICDQGGECELQDQALGYGKDVSKYTQGKRSIPKKDIGPLVDTDLTRCIQCTRCVRFGEEIVGRQELGLVCRGEHEEIATFLDKELDNELSGNIIDLCPVGALTNKPFRYQARPWELRQHPLISPHDSTGSNFFGHVRSGQLMRIVPQENDAINEAWLSDRDRYGMYGLVAEDRLTEPMIKRDDEWETVSWELAIETIVRRLTKITDQHGATNIGGLAASNSTTEELYLFQKLLRAFGSNNIDHRLGQVDFNNPVQASSELGIDLPIADIAKADRVLLVGANVNAEQPIISIKLRQAALNGAEINVINPADYRSRFTIANKEIVSLNEMTYQLAALTKAILAKSDRDSKLNIQTADFFKTIKVSNATKAMAASLLVGKSPLILTGVIASAHPQANLISNLISLLKQTLGAKGGNMLAGANAYGAHLAGALPHVGAAGKKVIKAGYNVNDMLGGSTGLKAYILLNTELPHDSAYGYLATQKLADASCVIALTSFAGEQTRELADVMLPISTFAETSGTYVNMTGEWQSFTAAARAPGEVKPAWKVLRVLANFLDLPGFEYDNSQAVLAELKDQVGKMKPVLKTWELPGEFPQTSNGLLMRIGTPALYATDSLTRRSKPLQQTNLMHRQRKVTISAASAKKLDVTTGDLVQLKQAQGEAIILATRIDASLPEKSVLLATGINETVGLGMAFGAIEVTKAVEKN